VRPYWRDAHSPGIARRPGIYEYRHYPLDAPLPDLFGSVPGIEFGCPDDARLMWLSDVRYADEAGMAAFSVSPGPYERGKLLGDIDMIVDRSTTYRVLGGNGRTLLDKTPAAPSGPSETPVFQVFFRARHGQAAFRESLAAIARRWAQTRNVARVRYSLFEVPDMEAERKAGYPIKTHPPEQQYQGWIDLFLNGEGSCAGLLHAADSAEIATVHAYPAPAAYTFNYLGRPTLSGLRGYPAVAAIRALGATHQTDPALLRWMYGDVAEGVVT
jgi:hypothetical protein